MRKEKSIKKNMLLNMLLTASTFVFPLITYSYVARILTPSGTGQVAFVASILQYFSYIAILGVPAYGMREASRLRDDKEKFSHIIQELLIINLVTTVIAYVALFITVLSIPKLLEYQGLFIVMSISILLGTLGVEWVYQSLEEYSYITIRSLFFRCISVALTFMLIRDSGDILWYGFISTFVSSANYILNIISLRKHISLKKTSPYNFKPHLKPIFIFFFSSIVISIYANFDISMIGFISSNYEVGLYNAALKIKSIVLSLSTASTAVFLPRISYYLKQREFEKTNRLLINSVRISLLIAVPLFVYIFLEAENVLLFIGGENYITASNTLKVLMLCVLPLILTSLFGNQILVPLGKEKIYSQSVFVSLWINLILNFMLIPSMGAFGAAIGTLVTECWNVFWMGRGVGDYKKILIEGLSYWKYGLGLIVSTVIFLVIREFTNDLPVFWHLSITVIAFFVPYYATLIITKETGVIEQMEKLLSKFRRARS